MSKSLKEINQEFENKSYHEWLISDVIDDLDFASLKCANDLQQSFETNAKSKISNESAKAIIKAYDENYNLLIRCVLDSLIASCDETRNQSRLAKDCKEIIALYFSKLGSGESCCSLFNMTTVLQWTLTLFPDKKQDLKSVLLTKLASRSIKERANIIQYFINTSSLLNFFTKEEYQSLFQSIYILNVSRDDADYYYSIYLCFLKTSYGESKDGAVLIKEAICDYVLKNMIILDDRRKPKELKRIRKWMDEVGKARKNETPYSPAQYQLVDDELERVGKKIMENMHEYSVSLPFDICKKMENGLAVIESKMKSLPKPELIDFLVYNTPIVSMGEIEKDEETMKKSLLGFVENDYFDEDGQLINDDSMTELDQRSLNAHNVMCWCASTENFFWLKPFFKYFKVDANTKPYLKSKLSKSRLVSQNNLEELISLIMAFLKQDFQYSVFNFILEFEASLRHYFKTQGMNIKKRNASGDYLDLNAFFNFDKNNIFRDKLYETIDEGYYFALEWLLTDRYGLNLRNRIAHRIHTKQLYNTSYALYAMMLIWLLYWSI